MLKWEINNEDEKLKNEIQRCKEEFDSWFDHYWDKSCSKEKMLSEQSPVQHAYYKMCKSFDEVKEKFPAKERCSDCGKIMSEWIETEFSFCDEYGCGIKLCKECSKKLKVQIEKWL